MAFNPALDGHKINMRSEYADTVTRKWTRAEVDNIMQQLVFDANSSSLASEAMTLDAVDAEWMGEMMVLDSAVITTNMRTLNGKFTESISRTLTRKLSPDLSISGNEVGKVKKSGLYASIAAIFHVNDGQTVTIIFHAPDGDPKVISPDDTLIAFRVLMNKTDITSHVLPQLISTKGVTSLDQVSTNIASLLKANSETFKGKQAQIANQKKELEAKTAELRKLESAQVEAVQMEADAEKHMTDADEKGAGLESRIKRVEEENTVLQEKIDKLKAKKVEVQPEPQPSAVSAIPGKLDFVASSLAKYGASLSPEGFIVSKTGTVTSVKPVVKGKRLRFEGKDGSLIASGATTEQFVSEFVERYWYWEKPKEAEAAASPAAPEIQPEPEITEDQPKEPLIEKMRVWADELVDGKYASFEGFVISSLNDYSDDEKTEMFEHLGLVKGKSNFTDFKKALRKYWDSRSSQRTERKKKTNDEATEAGIRLLMQRAQAEHDLMMGNEEDPKPEADPYASRIEALIERAKIHYPNYGMPGVIASLEPLLRGKDITGGMTSTEEQIASAEKAIERAENDSAARDKASKESYQAAIAAPVGRLKDFAKDKLGIDSSIPVTEDFSALDPRRGDMRIYNDGFGEFRLVASPPAASGDIPKSRKAFAVVTREFKGSSTELGFYIGSLDEQKKVTESKFIAEWGKHFPRVEQAKTSGDGYTPRIEALRTMPLKEYETAMDALIAELEDAGKLADYEAVLTEIDKARDEDLKKLVEGA